MNNGTVVRGTAQGPHSAMFLHLLPPLPESLNTRRNFGLQ